MKLLLARQARMYLCVLIVLTVAHAKGHLGADDTFSLGGKSYEVTEEVRRSWED